MRLDSLNKNCEGGKRNGKNSLACGIFVLSVEFSVSPLLCRVSFYLLNLTVSFVREHQQQRAVHFALSLTKVLSHNRFTQFFCQVCKTLLSLSSCAALLLSLSHYRSLWPVRAFLSACAFFAFSPSCGDELLLFSLSLLGGSLNCGAFVLLFSSITVSFAALRLFCCFAFCLAFASAAALAWPCCCCRCAATAALLYFAIRTRISL